MVGETWIEPDFAWIVVASPLTRLTEWPATERKGRPQVPALPPPEQSEIVSQSICSSSQPQRKQESHDHRCPLTQPLSFKGRGDDRDSIQFPLPDEGEDK